MCSSENVARSLNDAKVAPDRRGTRSNTAQALTKAHDRAGLGWGPTSAMFIHRQSLTHTLTRGYRHVGIESFDIGSIGVKLEFVPLLVLLVVLEVRLFAVTLAFRICVISSKPIQIDIDRCSQVRARLGQRPSTARKAINCEVTKVPARHCSRAVH